MKTIVVFTPCALAKDSRTYKQALSFVRFGYKCIVLQGEEAPLDGSEQPFELRTIGSLLAARKKSSCSAESKNLTEDKAVDKSNYTAGKAVKKSKLAAQLKGLMPPWLRYAASYTRYLYRWWHFNRTIEDKIPDADLYYIHFFDAHRAIERKAKRLNVPVIYDAHDFHCQVEAKEHLRAIDRYFIKPFQWRLERRCVANARNVVTVCDGVAGLLRNTFGCKPIVVRNCHDERLDHYQGTNLKTLLGISKESFLVVSVGNGKKGMAIEEACEALTMLPEKVHLAFLGGAYEDLKASPAYQRVSHRVHVIPPVKPFEVVPLISGADASIILYYPRSQNYLYSLPNRFFQSISAELPLLYPNLPEIARLASQYDLGIAIDPQNPRSIAEGVELLLKNPEKCHRFKQHCIAAKRALSWSEEEKILEDVLGKVMS